MPKPQARPGNLRASLDRLERILASSNEPLSGLSDLAEPTRLDFLFRLELLTILRAGPKAEVAPERLLAVAQDATETGILPVPTVPALRRMLRRLEKKLYTSGAWDPAQPLWWSPLPETSTTEQLWRKTSKIAEMLGGQRLAESFIDAGPRWSSLPSLVPESLIKAVHDQLEAAYEAGALGLERAGVGADERLTSRRSDSVLYLSGLEPELVRTAPAMASLVQWCLAHLGGRLAKSTSLNGIYPPANVMLARYPGDSGGYHPHFDNPGGERDNGRTLTFVLYLNASEKACAGGEIAVWAPGASASESPASVLPAVGGSAVLFDARQVVHQVKPVAAGPARWAMTLWFSDSMQVPPASPPAPSPSLTELLLPIDDPPVMPGKVLFHDLRAGEVTVRSTPPSEPRVGAVCTVYRGGANLDAWCEHHFDLGFDHLVLVFDRLEEAEEAADAARLKARYAPGQLTVWSGADVATKRWGNLNPSVRGDLENYASSGAACWSVAARQTLNASAALEAARGDELGGAPLDWLLHLDADELFYLEGAGRGGATLHQHFSAAQASGVHLLRYANHELLERSTSEWPARSLRFKLNPHLATARLGQSGWSMLVAHLKMEQTDPRPYFTGYFNGKAAVAVAQATGAAGVHSWTLKAGGEAESPFLAGPSVFHCHFADAASFRRKYLAAEAAGDPPGSALFEPSPVEVATFGRIRTLRQEGADEATLASRLEELHTTLTSFTDEDVELLEAAGLVVQPAIKF